MISLSSGIYDISSEKRKQQSEPVISEGKKHKTTRELKTKHKLLEIGAESCLMNSLVRGEP